MSGLEDRCVQFHEAALGTGKSKGPAKEIATLRRFLHKNQTQRFTDKATSRLLDTIQIYATNKKPTGDASVVSMEDREGLLEDALKMPFTVFTTKQKKTMLKWIEDLRGEGTPKTTAKAATAATTKLSVIDLEGGLLSLMQEDTGDTHEEIPLPAGDLGSQIQTAFERTEDAVDVEATMEDGKVTILKICS